MIEKFSIQGGILLFLWWCWYAAVTDGLSWIAALGVILFGVIAYTSMTMIGNRVIGRKPIIYWVWIGCLVLWSIGIYFLLVIYAAIVLPSTSGESAFLRTVTPFVSALVPVTLLIVCVTLLQSRWLRDL